MCEVVFSQQAVGMIPGVAQCRERDHRDDIPTLLMVSRSLAKPTTTNWLNAKSPPGVHLSRVCVIKERRKWSGMGGWGEGEGEVTFGSSSTALWSGFNVLIKTWYLLLFCLQLHLCWLCYEKLALSVWAEKKSSFSLLSIYLSICFKFSSQTYKGVKYYPLLHFSKCQDINLITHLIANNS